MFSTYGMLLVFTCLDNTWSLQTPTGTSHGFLVVLVICSHFSFEFELYNLVLCSHNFHAVDLFLFDGRFSLCVVFVSHYGLEHMHLLSLFLQRQISLILLIQVQFSIIEFVCFAPIYVTSFFLNYISSNL